MTRLVSVGLLLCFVESIAAEPPATWMQWRGPNRDAVVTGAAWPSKLEGNALTELWSVSDLGPSYSGPIVTEKLVIVTESLGRKGGRDWELTGEAVRAFDRKTGKPVWTFNWTGSMKVPFFAARNGSWIRSTPAADADTVYVAGMKDLLVALELATGKEKWRVDFPAVEKSNIPAFGCVCSPLLDDSAVYIQAGGAFVKVDKKTGKIVWRVLEEKDAMMGSAFSSPVFATLAGKSQIVVQTRTRLAGVDSESGKVLWEKQIPSFRGMNILTPTQVGDGIFTSTYGGNTRVVSVKTAGADTFLTDDAWSLKYEGNMTSPVIINGHAYWQGKDRRVICADLKTGKECWRTEERFGEYWNLVAGGDKILALDARGILFLIQADPTKFTILDKRTVSKNETWAHLAVCGDEIYIRDLTGLTVYRWRDVK